MICITKEKAEKFKKALKGRKIDILKMANMGSGERIKIFKKLFGDEAAKINLLFEQKLVLKNRLRGLKNFVEKLGQIGRYDLNKKAEAQKLLDEWKAKQRERILSPKENEVFYKSLAEHLLGTAITKSEAGVIWGLENKADNALRREFDFENGKWKSQKGRYEYGLQQGLIKRVMAELEGNTKPIKELLKGRYEEFKQEFNKNKISAIYHFVFDVLRQVRDNSVAVIASIDNSFQFRQGYNVLVNNPKIWQKGFRQSWKDLWGSLKGNAAEVQLAIDAEMMSRPNYILGRDKIGGIELGLEEAFPTLLPSRIPVVGRFFTGAEKAFVGSASRMRAGLFDWFLEIQERGGADINDPQVIKMAGKLANQMTARSKLGRRGGALFNHYLFWAPRMIKSAWDTLLSPIYPDVSPFFRKQASLNLLRFILSVAATKAVASAINPDSVTNDPRSTDFKNIRAGNTRFSFGVGEMALITLASRLVPTLHNGEWGWWYVDENGVYKKFEGKFGQRSPFDAVITFLSNKAAPFPTRVVIDYLQQRTFGGDKPTFLREMANLATPITIQQGIQAKELMGKSGNTPATLVLGVIMDALGFSVNTYSSIQKNWENSKSEKIQKLKQKVSKETFERLNDKYNNIMAKWINNFIHSPKFSKMSDEEKLNAIRGQKIKVLNSVLRQYHL